MGSGGWPTIRYYNKETGYGGKPYKKKTSDSMDEELGDEARMQAYIEEFGGTSLCDVVYGTGCSEKELKFINQWHLKTKEEFFAEKTKNQNDIAAGNGDIMKSKKRVTLLGRIFDSVDPELPPEA